MTTVKSAPTAPPVPHPQWDPNLKHQRTQVLFAILVIVVIVIWVALLWWVLGTPTAQVAALALPAGADLALVLSPILVSAAGVERFLESFFSVVESAWKSLVAYLGSGLQWLKATETELVNAREWLDEAAAYYQQQMAQFPQISPPPTNPADPQTPSAFEQLQSKLTDARALLTLAEQRVATAEANLASIVCSESYRDAKTVASVVLGMMLGVIVAKIADLQLFALLGIAVVPGQLDVLITGLVIGSGANPVHSLVGLLQEGAKALNSVQGFLNRKA